MGEYSFWFILANFFVMLLGILAHFFKKKIKGENLDDIVNYFKSHFKNTLTTVIAGIVAFAGLVGSGGIGWVASFLLGYTADSIFNKSQGSVTKNGNGS